MKKKILSLALTLSMLVTLLCIGSVTASAADWDGTAAVSFSEGGDGSSANPYKIATATELKLFANIVNGLNLTEGFSQNTAACAKLTADIVLNSGDLSGYNGTDSVSWNQWFPIGYYYDTDNTDYEEDVYFEGIFDGQGHTVSGLYFNNPSQNDVGLFGRTGEEGSIIANVGVVNSYIKGAGNVGGVCGYNNYDSSITNCYNTGTVSGNGTVGGVCGRANGTLESCCNTGTVNGSNDVGGVCGAKSGTLESCCNTGTVNGSNDVGGVCGYNSYGTITNCYNTGTVGGNRYVGGVCGYNYRTITNCYNTGTVSGASKGGVYGNSGDSEKYGSITNCYYLDACGAGGDGTSKTSAQFKSGEVAYLLNGSTSEGELTWFMKNGLPTLDNSGDVAVFDGRNLYSVLEKHGTAVTYTVDPTYTVTIPQTVTLGETKTLEAENVVVDEGKQVNVKLTATSGANNTAFTVATAKGATLTYAIMKDSNAVAIGDTVLTVNPANGKTGSTTLSFSAPTGAQFSGTYKGTVTFTVSVDDIPA